MKIIITAGPTREPIDAVRFISNASSAKMGMALVHDSVRRGFSVTLVLGPVDIQIPGGVKVLRVNTAKEMLDVTLDELNGDYDVLISTAAISDYAITKTPDKKIKSGKARVLELTPTKKLTKVVKSSFPDLFVAAFKAEYGVSTKALVESARKKLKTENLDLIVANDIKSHRFGDDHTKIHIIEKGTKSRQFEGSKQKAGKQVMDVICCLLPSR